MDGFLRRWELHSLITWDFPEPLGHGTARSFPTEMYAQRSFPAALAEPNGEFQDQVTDSLAKRRNELGMSDLLEHAETYAQFARIHRLSILIKSRRRAVGLPCFRPMEMYGILADLHGSVGNVRRICEMMEQFKTGLVSEVPPRPAKKK